MTFELLEKCLASPASLYEVNYQDLKNLVAEYPWCQTFRSVLVKKAFLEKAPDYEALLHHNAGVCPDRSLLYKQIQELNELPTFPPNASSYFNEEGTLVVPDLGHAAVDNDYHIEASVGIVFEQDQEQADPEVGTTSESEDADEEEDLWIPEINPLPTQQNGPSRKVLALEDLGIQTAPSLSVLTPVTDPSYLETEYSIPDLEESLMAAIDQMDFEDAHLPEEEIQDVPHSAPVDPVTPFIQPQDMAPKHEEPSQGQQPAPAPKASFTSWLKQLPDARQSLEKLSEHYHEPRQNPATVNKDAGQPEPESPVKIKKKKSKVRRIAELSVQPREETASETMALLLSNQGNYTQAIQMYERLQLIFPEKSDFFAARIEALKKEQSHE